MNQFYSIQTPLPPMLIDMIGVSTRTRYLGLFCQNKPTWTDGQSRATFNFYHCWKPLTDHPSILFPLQSAIAANGDLDECASSGGLPGLGASDADPTHLLLIDSANQKMAIALWNTGTQFLKAQHPARPQASVAQQAAEQSAVLALKKALRVNPTIQELSRFGMHEFVLPPDPVLVQQAAAMVEFLDRHLDPEIRQILNRFHL